MATVSTRSRITIKAKPNEIFKYLANTKYHCYWNPSIRSISDNVELAVGSTYDVEMLILKDIHLKCHIVVTDFKENKLCGLHNELGAIAYTVHFRLVPKDTSSTLVILDVSVLTKSRSFGLTLPVLKQLASNELKTDLRTLKVAVETKIGQ